MSSGVQERQDRSPLEESELDASSVEHFAEAPELIQQHEIVPASLADPFGETLPHRLGDVDGGGITLEKPPHDRCDPVPITELQEAGG